MIVYIVCLPHIYSLIVRIPPMVRIYDTFKSKSGFVLKFPYSHVDLINFSPIKSYKDARTFSFFIQAISFFSLQNCSKNKVGIFICLKYSRSQNSELYVNTKSQVLSLRVKLSFYKYITNLVLVRFC